MKKMLVLLFFVSFWLPVYANQIEGPWIGENGDAWLFYENGTVVRFRIIDLLDVTFSAEQATERRMQGWQPMMGLEEYRGTYDYNLERINIHFNRSYFNEFRGGGMTSRLDQIVTYEYIINNDELEMNEISTVNINHSTKKMFTRAFYTSIFNGEWFNDNILRLHFNDNHLLMYSELGNLIYNGLYFMNQKYICLYYPMSSQIPGGMISTIDNFSVFEFKYTDGILFLRSLRNNNEVFEEYIKRH